MLDKALVEERFTDEWWFQKLLQQMYAVPTRPGDTRICDSRRYDYNRVDWMNLLWSYRIGEPPLQRLSKQWSLSTREFLRLAKTNYPGLIVSALLERVNFTGVRTISDVPDTDGDDNVRRIFTANGTALNDAMEFSAVMGEGFVSVSKGGSAGALFAAEDPRNLIAAIDPVTGDVEAALKLYRDDIRGEHVAALYVLDDADKGLAHQTTFIRPGNVFSGRYFRSSDWERAPESRNAKLLPGYGIPIVYFPNKLGMGEFETLLDLIDRIFSGIANRLWAVQYQVFIQRGITGVRPDSVFEDENGNPVSPDDVFQADPGSLWQLPEGAEVWESKQMQIDTVLSPVKEDVRELAAASQTPLPTMLAESANGSAEGATLAREGISFKAEDRIARWSPAVVRLAKLALAYAGKEVPDELEAMAAPVERLSLAQRATAGAAAVSAGVPREGVWADFLQATPSQIKLYRTLRDAEQFDAQIAAAPAPAQRAQTPAAIPQPAQQPQAGSHGQSPTPGVAPAQLQQHQMQPGQTIKSPANGLTGGAPGARG